jgi:hypothetical protein
VQGTRSPHGGFPQDIRRGRNFLRQFKEYNGLIALDA